MTGDGALAAQRAQPYDLAKAVPAQECVHGERIFLGIEPQAATRCQTCGAADVTTCDARICDRVGAQVNQHRSLVRARAISLKRLETNTAVEDSRPFTADREYAMDIVIQAGKLCDATANSSYPEDGLLLDVTPAYPPSAGYLQRGSPNIDGSAAATSETRKNTHTALSTLAVECFERLRKCWEEPIDQVATSVAGS